MFINIKDARKHYGEGETLVNALDGVSLSLNEGRIYVILGPSGSGKSTLLNMIGGQRDTGCLQRTDKGRAESPERRTRHPLPDPPIAVRDHDVRCRDRYRLFRFPHPGDGCQPYQHHSQRSTGKRLRVTHGLLGEHARLCLFGR